MTDTKFFRLLSSLTVYERKRFRRYLCSPLHNEDKTFIALYDIVGPYLAPKPPKGALIQAPKSPKGTLIQKSSSLSFGEGRGEEAVKAPFGGLGAREVIGKKLFPKKKMGNQDYARLFTNFTRRIEGFMALEKYYSQPVREYTDLLESFNERHLDRYFPDMFQYLMRLHGRSPAGSGDYYLDTFRIEALQHEHLEARQQRSTNKNLLETLNALDIYYLVTKLRYCAAMLHYQEFLSLRGEVALIREILAHCADGRYDGVPLLRAYYYTVMSLIEPDREGHFAAMKGIIFSNTATFAPATLRELFSFAIVYCINKINYGHTAYQREIFELYKQALAKGIILRDGGLSPWDYKNIVTVGLRNKEYKWTDSFIESYVKKLPGPEQQNAYTFNRARYYFATQKYDKVLDLLQDVEYSDIFYLLDSKTTLMKTYYELGEYQPLQSLKESFRILLRRKKLISEQNSTNYGNFARFAMKLYRVDTKNKKQVAALRKEIEATGNVADRGWIIEKLMQVTGGE